MKQVKYYSTSYSSAQFKVACMCPEKPICAPPRLSDVSPTSPLKHCTTKEQKAYGSMKETVSAIIKEDNLYSSVHFQMVSMRSERPMCAPPRLSDIVQPKHKGRWEYERNSKRIIQSQTEKSVVNAKEW